MFFSQSKVPRLTTLTVTFLNHTSLILNYWAKEWTSAKFIEGNAKALLLICESCLSIHLVIVLFNYYIIDTVWPTVVRLEMNTILMETSQSWVFLFFTALTGRMYELGRWNILLCHSL